MRVVQTLSRGVMALSLAVVIGACSKSAGLVERVKAYQEAYNENKVDDVVGMFGVNPVYEMVGTMRLQSKDEIRDLAEYNIALNIHIETGNLQVSGDTVACDMTETNDWLTVAGIDTAYFDTRFFFTAGKIDKIVARPSVATAKAIQEVLVPLTRWASRYRPDLLADVMPGGTLTFNAVAAEKSLALLIDWQHATSGDTIP